MDTRRLSGPFATLPPPMDDAPAVDVEIVELTAIAGGRRGLVARLLFVATVALLGGLLAVAGMPARDATFAFDTPLPNFLAPAPPN